MENQRFLWLRRFFAHSRRFYESPLATLRFFAVAIATMLWFALKTVAGYFWHVITAPNHRIFWYSLIGIGAALLVVSTFLYFGVVIYVERQMHPADMPDNIVYLDQGWGKAATSDDRMLYYYSPQGSFVKDVRYRWLENLERPWKRDRFAAPQYMRAYGFIEDNTQTDRNPGRLPVGFAARYDANAGEMMLDLTCAACHSGELQYVRAGTRYAVRIDGGSGNHNLTGSRPGQFGLDLLVSLGATYVNPWKFSRFAASYLKENDTGDNRQHLARDMRAVIGEILSQTWTETRLHVYPVQEGFGRTDGLGRILNTAFAERLSEKNYRVANAPVSYPFVWEIPMFDWVQYTGSVRQPMARNIGEALGTGARYYLTNPYGMPLPASERFDASIKIANLDRIEHALRRLKPPCWPEDLFGAIDRVKAARGKTLFDAHCKGCHGPHVAPEFVTLADAPWKLKAINPTADRDFPHWMMKTLSVEDIGTDPASALNFFRYRLDLTPTGMTPEEVRNELRPYYETNYHRQVAFYEDLAVVMKPGGASGETGEAVCGLPAGKAIPRDKAQVNRWKAQAADADWPWPSLQDACATLKHLTEQGPEGYLKEQLGDVNLNAVSLGDGLNYLITLVRDRAYQDMGIDGPLRAPERNLLDGFAQLDIPQTGAVYKARPLAGIWATPPFLHNGSVPTLYQLLIPAYQRTKKFYRRAPLFDPYAVGLYGNDNQKGAFLFDTTIVGNSNSGHEFRAGYQPYKPGNPPAWGVIGPELTDDERWAIIEYLKIHRDQAGDSVCPEENLMAPESSASTGKTL